MKEILAILNFWLIFLLKNHSLRWINEGKIKFPFSRVGGGSSRLLSKGLGSGGWWLGVCMHHWQKSALNGYYRKRMHASRKHLHVIGSGKTERRNSPPKLEKSAWRKMVYLPGACPIKMTVLKLIRLIRK